MFRPIGQSDPSSSRSLRILLIGICLSFAATGGFFASGATAQPSGVLIALAVGLVALLGVTSAVLIERASDRVSTTRAEPLTTARRDREAEQALRETLDRTQRQLYTVGLASQLESVVAGDVHTAVRQIAELAADATGCARISVWLFNDDGSQLHCIDLYELSARRHSSGMMLREPDFRSEFQALKHSRYVDADDPMTDPRTAGYTTSYLAPLGITSMLDAVIRVEGRNVGVLCFEHVAQPHHWERDEISFACQLADKISVTLLTETRLRSERRVRESEAALEEAQAIAHVGSWEFDLEHDTLTWSRETYRIFGTDPADFVPSYEAVLARTHPDDRSVLDTAYKESVANAAGFAVDHRLLLEGGVIRHVHARGRTFVGPDGRPVRSVGTTLDITDRKQVEERLQFVNTLLTTQMETSPDGVLVLDQGGAIISSNRRFGQMFGLPEDLVRQGRDAPVLAAITALMKEPAVFAERVRHLYDCPDEGGHEEVELRDGRFMDRHTSPLRGPGGEHLGRVWFFRDITDRKRAEAEIRHTARHDGLTGLANRFVFKEAIEQAIARARRGPRRFAILCLDLDHFKDVNDTLGHPAGDELLQLAADRLRTTCRATDTIARFGGDEFAVIASDIADPADAAVLAGALIRALGTPFIVREREVRTGGSIGIALYEHEQDGDPETLLSRADVALYRAKAEGRGTFRFFTDVMDQEVQTRVAMGAELREAIGSERLFLLYQPQIDIATGRITGVEALVRWRHDTRGVVEPAVFIPLAEKSGLIGLLSVWVLREAGRQARAWMTAGLMPGGLAINLSALQFKAPSELENEVSKVLAGTGLPPRMLELELTETALMVASRENNDVISRLRARGVRVAIDDFGTGYSSLDYLRRFPVDRIKIPREFVHQVSLTSGGSAAIVRATIGLARELGISVIAEGVESDDQLRLLRSWGCQHAQGFYFSEPLTADALTPLLQQGGVPLRPPHNPIIEPVSKRLH